MNVHDLRWSPPEKKVARRAFEAALESALAKVMTEFKRRAEAATTPAEMWETESYLRQQRRQIDETFDYRYSQLPLVFARLIHAGHLDENRLGGLSEEKLKIIRSRLSLAAKG
jgi:Photoprotection regulator fluorescence recovery protein